MTEHADYKFFFPFRVRYSEIDGQMIVYNAHYLTYLILPSLSIVVSCRLISW